MLRTDLTLAWRTLRKTPGLSVGALLCLATAIGVATAAFTVINGALLSALPVPHADRLVMAHEIHRAGGFNVLQTPGQFTYLRGHSASFEALGAWYTRNVTLSASPGAEAAGLVRGSGSGERNVAHVAPVSARYRIAEQPRIAAALDTCGQHEGLQDSRATTVRVSVWHTFRRRVG